MKTRAIFKTKFTQMAPNVQRLKQAHRTSSILHRIFLIGSLNFTESITTKLPLMRMSDAFVLQ